MNARLWNEENVPGYAQIRKIYDLIQAGVKFSHCGGQFVRTKDGRRFYRKHYDVAKAVQKFRAAKRKEIMGDKQAAS